MKQKSCFLLGRARSGTTVFRSFLHTHPNIVAYPEILSSDARENYFSYLCEELKKQPNMCMPDKSIIMFEKYISFLKEKNPTKEVVVFDIKYECIHVIYRPWEPVNKTSVILEKIHKNNDYLIHLTRNNHLKRIVSNIKAQKTGIYHVRKNIESPEPGKIHINPMGLMEKFRAFDVVYLKTKSYFEDFPRYFEMDYENLFSSVGKKSNFNNDIVSRLCEFLDVQNLFNNEPQLKKMSNTLLSEVIENYSEIQDLLNGTEYEGFLDS